MPRRVLVGLPGLALLIALMPASVGTSLGSTEPLTASWGPIPEGAETVTLKGLGGLVSADAPSDLEVAIEGPEPGPQNRLEAWVAKEPGTKKWITLDYGPYTIHPGSDFSRVDVELAGADGFATGFVPEVVYPDGKLASSHDIHIHHAHWFWLDPENPDSHRWFYGTGEERTQGSIMPAAKADPRYRDGMRYGIKVGRGDRLSFLSMLHNKTPQALEVYLRVRIEFVYGTHDQIKKEKGLNFHRLTPVLTGSTFNVPRSSGFFTFPRDTSKKTIGPHSNYNNPKGRVEVTPGVGHVWTVPWNGTVVIGAGHLHPGGRFSVLSNMGRPSDPCPNDGDRFPGVTAVRSREITRGDVFPSEEYQMGLTHPAWRLHVRKGDRLAFNGVYDSSRFAYPDAMNYFGLYIDRDDPTTKSEACKVELIGRPNASSQQITHTIPNQEWPSHHPMPTCRNCNDSGPLPERGAETNTVHIAGFQYLPGNLGLEGQPFGPPVVRRGETLTFVNEDYAAGMVRHSITSCRAPCNGPYTVNNPFHDGRFHSGALGYMWQETYINGRAEPYWELDTSKLEKGYYTYYCQLHAWMRGSFYVRN